MITFCNPPLASATTSCESMGAECSLAQLGSAAMLIGFPFGTVPSSFTTPRTLADADPVLKEAGPAARPPVRANNRIRPGTKILVFILHLTKFITSGDETRPARLRSRLLHDESGSAAGLVRSEEHTSELQSHHDLVCRLLLEKKKKPNTRNKIATDI